MSTTNEKGLRPSRVQYPSGVDLNELCCPICLNILWRPVACQSCESPFCSTCISKTMQGNSGQCPMKCYVYKERACPPFIFRQLTKMRIDCIYQPNGCKEVCSFRHYYHFFRILTVGFIVRRTRKTWSSMRLSAPTMSRLSTKNFQKEFCWSQSSMSVDWIDMSWLQTCLSTTWCYCTSYGKRLSQDTVEADATRIGREQTTSYCNARAFM